MAIRWSRKAKRFYDDQTGYPVNRTRGLRSSIGRKDYKKASAKRRKERGGYKRSDISNRRKPEKPYRAPRGYRVRQLDEEFAEELEQFDGTLDEDMDFDDYMEFLDDDQGDVMESEDSYSED